MEVSCGNECPHAEALRTAHGLATPPGPTPGPRVDRYAAAVDLPRARISAQGLGIFLGRQEGDGRGSDTGVSPWDLHRFPPASGCTEERFLAVCGQEAAPDPVRAIFWRGWAARQ